MIAQKTCLLAMLCGGVAFGGTIVSIDEFDDPFPNRTIGAPGPTFDTNALLLSTLFPGFDVMDSVTQTNLNVLGGERRASLFASPDGPGSFDTARIENGELSISTPLNPGHTLQLEYGFDTDLNFNAADELQLMELVFNFDAEGDQDGQPDSRPFDVKVTMTSNRGEGGETTTSFTQEVLQDGSYFVNLDQFLGLDVTDIDAITIEIDLTQQSAVDVSFEGFRLIGVVPSPGSVALLGLGGLAVARRRR